MKSKILLAIFIILSSGCSLSFVHKETMTYKDMEEASCRIGYKLEDGKLATYESFLSNDKMISDEMKILLIDSYQKCLNKKG
jgi:hypothetical protein